MPKIDIPIKRLFQLRAFDWIKFIQPECTDEMIKPFKSDYVPKLESRLDEVFEVTGHEGSYYVNVEPMGYYDRKLPARMMRYRSDIWEATLHDKKGTPSILQVVIFFYPEHDNNNNLLTDIQGEITLVHYTYKVIRVWEYFGQDIIDQKLIGLYPLLPLMKGEPGESAKEVLMKSVAEIGKVEDGALQKDLLAVLAIMAGKKHSLDFVKSLIRREMLMESPIYQYWFAEEVAEAEARAKVKNSQEIIYDYLLNKFSATASELHQKVLRISTPEILTFMLREMFSASTLEEVKAVINDGVASDERIKKNKEK